MNCKVRFAPSPTGFMHVGNARIAIINYLLCRKNCGKFLFRIDDTDVLRSKSEYEDAIKEDMSWLGISYDETFRQSERLKRYHEVMDKLIADGLLYPCYETQEELEYKRKFALSKGRPPVYDRASLNLTKTEEENYKKEGRIPYWRFKLPQKTISWKDLILGEISYDLNSVSDPVIVKTDGTFLYTFSSVVDDFDSGITHIIRGQDHVTNTAVQIAMLDEISNKTYKVDFAHLSLLVNKDGSQFSKRLGSTNLGDIRKQGVDPMAIFDVLATLGSSLDTLPFSKIDDLVNYFDITKFSSNSPKFDIEDIFKINRKILHSKPYSEICQFGLSEKEYDVVKGNIDTYNNFSTWKNIFSKAFVSNYVPNDEEIIVLKAFEHKVTLLDKLTRDNLENVLSTISDELRISGKQLYHPIRMAVTGLASGANLVEILLLLTKEEILSRVNSTYSRLAPIEPPMK